MKDDGAKDSSIVIESLPKGQEPKHKSYGTPVKKKSTTKMGYYWSLGTLRTSCREPF